MVQAFIDSKELPDLVDNSFTQTLKTILAGLQKVVIKKADLLAKLSARRPPAPDNFKKVLGAYVDELERGKTQPKSDW